MLKSGSSRWQFSIACASESSSGAPRGKQARVCDEYERSGLVLTPCRRISFPRKVLRPIDGCVLRNAVPFLTFPVLFSLAVLATGAKAGRPRDTVSDEALE